MKKIKVAIADDHEIVRAGFKQFIMDESDMEVVAEASSGQEALAIVRREMCDVLLLDISMPGQNGVDTLRSIRLSQPDIPVLILSGFPEEQYALNLLRLGATGYLSKDCEPSELFLAIRTAAKGKPYVSASVGQLLAMGLGKDHETPPHETLSDRELQVFLRLAQGETVGDIANVLNISAKTVSTYRTRILEKLQLKTNSDLTYYAVKNNIVQ